MLSKRPGEAVLGTREQPQLKRRQTESSNCVIDFENYEVLAACYGDKGMRKQMEDEHLMLPSLLPFQPSITSCDFAIFGVFDGHGGRQSAAFVKEALPAEIAAQLLLLQQQKQQQDAGASAEMGEEPQQHGSVGDASMNGHSNFSTTASALYNDADDMQQERRSEELSDRDMKQVLYGAFRKVDARIATEIPACRDGCTAILVLLRGRQAYIACLGDSAAYLARKKDATLHSIPLSEVHRHWVIEEKERIARMGGTIENGRVNGSLEVTRSFGDISLKRYGVSCIPTVKKFTIEPSLDKFLLLGCDGFWSCWTAREAVTFAAELWEKEARASKVHSRNLEPQNVCKQLVEHVLIEKKAQDNITCMLLRLVPRT